MQLHSLPMVRSCRFRTIFGLLPVVLTMCLAAPGLVLAQDAGLAQIKEKELEAVREAISVLKQSMDRRAADRDRITNELQAAEALIAEKRNNLKDIERQRDYSQKQVVEIEQKLAEREAALDQEIQDLAMQVRAAYVSGSEERLKLLLNQHDPATLGRLLVYHRYFSDMRGDNIDKVNATIEELAALRAAAAKEEARLAGLARARYAELTELDAAQTRRRGLLDTLQAKLAEEGSQIERLAAEEEDLQRLITELTSILSDYPITSEDPFSKLQGELTWPVAGNLLHDFGQPRAGGQLNWNGVVLSAPRGREVRAVYHGRVIFADWLAGLGLLVIVDHGEGYMTLYGYNETTLKEAGDWVAPGDVIATVGDSGGRPQTGLYFEIRQGTRPLNPRRWVSRQPKTG